MTSKSKRQVVLATWPHRLGYGFVDASPYHMPGDTCEGIWLSFRLRNPDNSDDYISSRDADVVSDIGLYVWYAARGTVQLEFKAHSVHSMDVGKCEAMLKTLRKYAKRMEEQPRLSPDSIGLAIAGALDAIGVRMAVQHNHGEDSYSPVGASVARIAETLAKTLVGLRANEKTAYPEYSEA